MKACPLHASLGDKDDVILDLVMKACHRSMVSCGFVKHIPHQTL
jgi:hypothetical protein